MNAEQAKQALGLEVSASNEEALAELNKKRAQVEEKLASAPTEALKAKFEQMRQKLNEVEQALRAETSAPSPRSPLSETKMADLPGFAPRGSQGDAGGGQQLQLNPGDTLAGRYEIKEQIGAGGMGAVYRAHDQNRAEDIAIKVLLPSLTANERARERFLDEARLSSKLSHPNIVNVYDVQHDGDLYFITMELLEGQDLRGFIENHQALRQKVEISEALEIVAAVCEGLVHAHEHTVHRDIKPENIFLAEDGKVKLMDFGIARLMSTSQRTQTGTAMGTAYYMAPEQLKGRGEIDGRADQYALGVLLYELLTGDVPTGRIQSLNKVRNDVPRSLSMAVDKALSPKPEDRYEIISAFLAAMREKGGGISLPSLPIKTSGIVAGIILAAAVVAVLVSNGGLAELYDAIRPISQEELAAQKSRAVNLKGQLGSVKGKLDSARRRLAQDARDAERNKDSNLNSLNYWQKLTEDNLFGGSQWIALQGEEAVADTFLQDKQYSQSAERFAYLLEQYQKLYDAFNGAENLYGVGRQAKTMQKQYMEYRSSARIPDAVQRAVLVQLNQKMAHASQSITALDFSSAARAYKEASAEYENAGRELTPVVNLQREAESSRQKWEAYQARYKLSFDESEKVNAESAMAEANSAMSKGDLVAASTQYDKSQAHYAALQEAGEQVVSRQRTAEQQRQEKERIRLAKIASDKKILDGVDAAKKAINKLLPNERYRYTDYDDGVKSIDTYQVDAFAIDKCEVSVSETHGTGQEHSGYVGMNYFDKHYTNVHFMLAGVKDVEYKEYSKRLEIAIKGVANFASAEYLSKQQKQDLYRREDKPSVLWLSVNPKIWGGSVRTNFRNALLNLKAAAGINGCNKTR